MYKNAKKLFLGLILCLVLSPLGCSALDVFKDTSGVDHTKAGDTVIAVGTTMKEVGGFVPGYGTLFSLIGGLVVVAGGLVTSISKGLSVSGQRDAMITAVAKSDSPNVEKAIEGEAARTGVLKPLHKRVKHIKAKMVEVAKATDDTNHKIVKG